MRLRTQLVLAAFVLAVLPLAAIVLYSYDSSRRAIKSAYRAEASRMTRQMNSRVASIRSDLDTRLAAVTTLPLQTLPKSGESGPHPVLDEIAMAMGDAAPLVDSLQFQPEHPVVEERVVERSARREPSSRQRREEEVEAPVAPAPPEIPERGEPIVIEIPSTSFPAFTLPPKFHQQMGQLATLSRTLVEKKDSLTPEQQAEMRARIAEINEEVQQQIAESKQQFEAGTEERKAFEKERLKAWRALQRSSRVQVATVEPAAPTPQVGATGPVPAPAVPPAPAAADPSAAPRPRHRYLVRDPASITQRLPVTVPAVPLSAVKPGAAVASKPKPAAAVAQAPKVVERKLSIEEKQRLRERARQVASILGHNYDFPVQTDGKLIGRITAQVSPEELVKRVLGPPSDDGSEIAFAVDRDGHLYARSDQEKRLVQRLGLDKRVTSGQPMHDVDNWVVAASSAGGLRLGVARRIGDNLVTLQQTAARNFGYGLALVAFALIGIVPLANHMTRDVNLVTAGAHRIAHGDLQTRLPVRSKNEFGQLAQAFNRMASDLAENQRRLVEEERARREQELQQRLLGVEYDRKAAELEEARRFQLSLLPKEVPHLARYDVGVFIQTATEVGGDYYDFHVSPDGRLTVTIGDATGHGAKAGTMVTVIKTLFSGYSADIAPAEFLVTAGEKIKRMDLGRMAMALSVARFEKDAMLIASAGMPPALVHRGRSGTVDEIALEATPLGTLGTDYAHEAVPIADGDTVLFMSDGLPELTNADGQQLGYGAAAAAFQKAVSATARETLDGLVASVREWHGEQPPNDDITFVVVRVREA